MATGTDLEFASRIILPRWLPSLSFSIDISLTIIEQAKAFILHFEEQITLYQSQLVINLLDQKGKPMEHYSAYCLYGLYWCYLSGAEIELSDAYAGYLKHINSPKIKYLLLSMLYFFLKKKYKLNNAIICRYVGFDFHEVCKGDNFEAVSKLVDLVDSDLKNIGWVLGWPQSGRIRSTNAICWVICRYFVQDKDGNGLAWQTGTPRVNCLDCLDRTNLVMSELARKVLSWQMDAFGVGTAWSSSRSIIERLFKEVPALSYYHTY